MAAGGGFKTLISDVLWNMCNIFDVYWDDILISRLLSRPTSNTFGWCCGSFRRPACLSRLRNECFTPPCWSSWAISWRLQNGPQEGHIGTCAVQTKGQNWAAVFPWVCRLHQWLHPHCWASLCPNLHPFPVWLDPWGGGHFDGSQGGFS